VAAQQNILIIDPNSMNRKLIQSLLEKQGYATHEAESIEQQPHSNFDIIIADSLFYGQLSNTTKVLYLAEDSPEVREVLPLDLLLFKPIVPTVLIEKITNLLPGAFTEASINAVFNEGESNAMQRVFELANDAIENSAEGPFAALITKDSSIIAEATDRVIQDNDPTAKATLLAIRQACAVLKTPSLTGCEIYLMAEPCPMCLSAIYAANLDRIYFANTLDDMAEAGLDVMPIFDEIRERPSKRYLPSQLLDHAEGNIILKKWQDMSDVF
jgi:tRNA(Arg) A34 adenosine deaminase TadA